MLLALSFGPFAPLSSASPRCPTAVPDEAAGGQELHATALSSGHLMRAVAKDLIS